MGLLNRAPRTFASLSWIVPTKVLLLLNAITLSSGEIDGHRDVLRDDGRPRRSTAPEPGLVAPPNFFWTPSFSDTFSGDMLNRSLWGTNFEDYQGNLMYWRLQSDDSTDLLSTLLRFGNSLMPLRLAHGMDKDDRVVAILCA